ERATMVAFALQRANPRAKVLVFDANPDVVAKRDQFRAVWESRYKGMIEYLPSAELAAVDAAAQTLKLEAYGAVKADVLNIIPPQAAGPLARRSGLVGAGGRWCEVDFLSYESKVAPGVHVIGDAVGAAPGMPKSGHMANQHGKVCAAAVLALLNGQPVNDEPIIINTCYSFVGEREVIHVTSVHRYDREKKTMVTVPGASGVSPQPNAEEGYLALAWAFNILNDTFG
ncbi:MAG: FCSD flavin-binding domain-containing protein, partial [Pseudomonadota bacterium]